MKIVRRATDIEENVVSLRLSSRLEPASLREQQQTPTIQFLPSQTATGRREIGVVDVCAYNS